MALAIAIVALVGWQFTSDNRLHQRLDTQGEELERASGRLDRHDVTLEQHRQAIEENSKSIAGEREANEKQQGTLDEWSERWKAVYDKLEAQSAALVGQEQRLGKLEALRAELDALREQRVEDARALDDLAARLEALLAERDSLESRLDRVEKALDLQPKP